MPCEPRNRRSWILAILATSVALASCSTVRVSTDYDPERDFSLYQTYAWMPDPPQVSDNPLLHNSLLDERVRRSVDTRLQAKGYRKVDATSADFTVNYYINLEQKISVDTIPTASYGYGYYGWYGGGVATETRVRQYEEGTLILDFVDRGEKQLVWRGTGSTRVGKSTTPEQSQREIDNVTSEILASFPPGRKR